MRLSTKVAYNTIIQITSKILATVLGLFAFKIMSVYLDTTGLGQYTTIVTFLSFFAIAADLGLTLITVKMISEPGVNENKMLNNLFALRFFSAFLFLGIAPFVVMFFPYADSVKVGVSLAVFSFFFIALNQVFVGFFQKKLRMDKIAISEIVGRVVLFIGVFISAKYDFGLNGFMIAMVLGSFFSFLLEFIFLNQFTKIKFEFDFSLWKEILQKSWPLSLTIVLNLAYLKTDTFILTLVKSEHEVGLYGAAYKVIEIITLMPFMLSGLILPILTTSWGEKNIKFFKRVLQKSFDLMVIIAVPLVVGTQFVAKELIVAISESQFADAGLILKILIVAVALIFISALLGHVIIAIDKQKEVIFAYFFTAISSVIGYLIFIPKYSYIGAASVTIYSELAITMFMFYYVIKFIKFSPKWNILPKVISASLVMCLTLYLIPNSFYVSAWGLVITLIVSSIIYFVFLYVFKGISKEDVHNLLNKKKA